MSLQGTRLVGFVEFCLQEVVIEMCKQCKISMKVFGSSALNRGNFRGIRGPFDHAIVRSLC